MSPGFALSYSLMMLSVFSWLIGNAYNLLWRNEDSNHLPIFNWIFLLLHMSLHACLDSSLLQEVIEHLPVVQQSSLSPLCICNVQMHVHNALCTYRCTAVATLETSTYILKFALDYLLWKKFTGGCRI
jgi:hypothetical protein